MRDIKSLITQTKFWKKDFKKMKTKIAQHVLEAGPDPYAGWAKGWPKWALSFRESLLLKRERERHHATLQAARLAGEKVPGKWLRNQKRKERKALAAVRRMG
jgi:hypothetical protein